MEEEGRTNLDIFGQTGKAHHSVQNYKHKRVLVGLITTALVVQGAWLTWTFFFGTALLLSEEVTFTALAPLLFGLVFFFLLCVGTHAILEAKPDLFYRFCTSAIIWIILSFLGHLLAVWENPHFLFFPFLVNIAISIFIALSVYFGVDAIRDINERVEARQSRVNFSLNDSPEFDLKELRATLPFFRKDQLIIAFLSLLVLQSSWLTWTIPFIAICEAVGDGTCYTVTVLMCTFSVFYLLFFSVGYHATTEANARYLRLYAYATGTLVILDLLCAIVLALHHGSFHALLQIGLYGLTILTIILALQASKDIEEKLRYQNQGFKLSDANSEGMVGYQVA